VAEVGRSEGDSKPPPAFTKAGGTNPSGSTRATVDAEGMIAGWTAISPKKREPLTRGLKILVSRRGIAAPSRSALFPTAPPYGVEVEEREPEIRQVSCDVALR
jgi:hypothetical protein